MGLILFMLIWVGLLINFKNNLMRSKKKYCIVVLLFIFSKYWGKLLKLGNVLIVVNTNSLVLKLGKNFILDFLNFGSNCISVCFQIHQLFTARKVRSPII